MTSFARMAFMVLALITHPVATTHAQRALVPEASRTETIEIEFQGRPRRYLLHVPPAPNGALALVFHGGGQPVAHIQEISGFDAISDREHFIVAYPVAVDGSWADGRNETSAEKQSVDDVAFAKAVVADIARTYTLDRRRVFAAGLSNGAIVSHRIACSAADTFAAIAAIVGTIATSTDPSSRDPESSTPRCTTSRFLRGASAMLCRPNPAATQSGTTISG